MAQLSTEDQQFKNIDYTEQNKSGLEFVNCEFLSCNFSKTDLRSTTFMDCTFRDCNLALAQLHDTGLKTCSFIGCKIIGVDFSVTNDFLFAVNFTTCQLDYSTFFKKKMKKTRFTGCSLKEADFSETDLTEAIFSDCDLQGTAFVGTNLEKADLRTTRNYSIDPEQNRIKKAKFSSGGIAGLLSKYNLEID